MTTNPVLENLPSTAKFRSINHSCPSCSSPELLIFHEVKNVPVHSCLMVDSAEEALNFPLSNISLAFCQNCGFITNLAFDSKWSAYAPNYEDQQSYSPTFNQFAVELANQLVKKYKLYNKEILEIGCSKGDFLFLLCELGNNRGVGIDPSAIPGRVAGITSDRVIFIQDYYCDRYSSYVGNFICCRHTLEHIYPTYEFVSSIRRSIGNRLDTVVFFELPDAGRVLKDASFVDIYYEHCSYFTPGSLARLFRFCGFEILDMYLGYGDQYLLIEAKPTNITSSQVHALEESSEQIFQAIIQFTARINQKLSYWQNYLEQMRLQRKKVFMWGSGSKCVAFLTTLSAQDKVQHIIDINPHRHGKFIPGVGKEIMPPDFLKIVQPDQIVIMNSIYLSEIQQMLSELRVATELVTI